MIMIICKVRQRWHNPAETGQPWGGQHQENKKAEDPKDLEEAVEQEGVAEEEDVQETIQAKVQEKPQVQETCQQILARQIIHGSVFTHAKNVTCVPIHNSF